MGTENTHHETPDVAKLRRLAEACPKPGSDPHILGPWWDAGDLARIPVDVPADREFIMAASPAAVLALLDDADALRAELAHMTEARDNARAEVERLSAQVEAVREWATACATQATDYDEDTEQQIEDGREVLRILDGGQR